MVADGGASKQSNSKSKIAVCKYPITSSSPLAAEGDSSEAMAPRQRKTTTATGAKLPEPASAAPKSSAADESRAIGEAVSAGASDSGASPWIAGARPSAASTLPRRP